MADRLPPHITEDDLRAVVSVVTPTIAAVALRDAAADTYEHTTIGQNYERITNRRFTLNADVRGWLNARADALERMNIRTTNEGERP